MYTFNLMLRLCFLYKCILQIQFYSKVVFSFILLIIMLCNITQLAFKLFYFLSSQTAKWTKIPRNKKWWLRCVFHIPLPPLLFIPKLLKWPLNSHQAEGFRSLSNYLSAAPRFCTLQSFRTSLVEDKCSSADLCL